MSRERQPAWASLSTVLRASSPRVSFSRSTSLRMTCTASCLAFASGALPATISCSRCWRRCWWLLMRAAIGSCGTKARLSENSVMNTPMPPMTAMPVSSKPTSASMKALIRGNMSDLELRHLLHDVDTGRHGEGSAGQHLVPQVGLDEPHDVGPVDADQDLRREEGQRADDRCARPRLGCHRAHFELHLPPAPEHNLEVLERLR